MRSFLPGRLVFVVVLGGIPALARGALSTARSNYAASCAGGGAPNLASSLALVYVHWMGFGC